MRRLSRTMLALLLGLAGLGVALASVASAASAASAAASGTDKKPEKIGKPRGGKKKNGAEGAVATDQFTGLFVPLNATDLHAPQASFRISGWGWDRGNLKLLELVPDGKEVKQGEEIARFEFDARDVLRWIQERHQRAMADREQARISTDQNLEGLRVEQRRKLLEAQLAALDVQRERAISRRQADLYKIAEKIATFEAQSVGQRIGSAQRSREAELSFHEQAVARVQQDLDRYKFLSGRFTVAAPHDGVVRHAFHPRERRKVQKGDNIQTGQRLISVAKDAALAVRFFVPEHRIFELQEGSEVTVVSAASGEERQARVKRVDFFPQELGFLRELPALPNAREKAFAVTAELLGSSEGLTAGTEVRVKVKGR